MSSGTFSAKVIGATVVLYIIGMVDGDRQSNPDNTDTMAILRAFVGESDSSKETVNHLAKASSKAWEGSKGLLSKMGLVLGQDDDVTEQFNRWSEQLLRENEKRAAEMKNGHLLALSISGAPVVSRTRAVAGNWHYSAAPTLFCGIPLMSLAVTVCALN